MSKDNRYARNTEHGCNEADGKHQIMQNIDDDDSKEGEKEDGDSTDRIDQHDQDGDGDDGNDGDDNMLVGGGDVDGADVAGTTMTTARRHEPITKSVQLPYLWHGIFTDRFIFRLLFPAKMQISS